MGAKYSNYHRSVFASKRGNWPGMDQGKGLLYRDNSVEMTLNADVRDNVLKVREGQERKTTSIAGIDAGKKTLSGVSVVSGTNMFFDEDFPSLSI